MSGIDYMADTNALIYLLSGDSLCETLFGKLYRCFRLRMPKLTDEFTLRQTSQIVCALFVHQCIIFRELIFSQLLYFKGMFYVELIYYY